MRAERLQHLTNQLLSQWPEESGFGISVVTMTRVEVFVDATLAFAGTILVKSINQIPCSVTELLVISKYKAVCILGAAQLVFIWHNHTISSKRIGLEGGKTVFSQWLGFWAILILSDGYPHWLHLYVVVACKSVHSRVQTVEICSPMKENQN